MRRNVGYYLLQGYIPAGLIVILSWISFWIDSEATADRVYIGLNPHRFDSSPFLSPSRCNVCSEFNNANTGCSCTYSSSSLFYGD